MQIAEKTWVNYINEMSKISDTAAGLMRAFIEKNGIQDRKKLIDYACALADRYGEAIAELSCQMYEATALAQGVQFLRRNHLRFRAMERLQKR